MKHILSDCWYNCSIRTKLMIFLIVLIVCISILSVYLISTAYGYLDNFNTNVNEYFEINMLHQYNAENSNLIEKYLDDYQMESLAQFNESIDSFYLALREIEANSYSLEAYLLIRSIKNSFAYYLEECNTAIINKREGNQDYLIHYYNSYRINQYLEVYISQFLELSLHEGKTVYSKLASDAKAMKYVIFLVISAFLLFCMVFGITFSNNLTKPIKHLADLSIQMSEGNLNIGELSVQSNDEVGILTKSFNKMSSSIKALVRDLKEKSMIEKRLHKEELINVKNKELLKEARFLALQSQINPHFLFNTLNTISREITFSRSDEAVRLVNSLSCLLRYNMGKGSMYVTLKDELNIMEQYVFIQQYRFGERLKVDIQCSGLDPGSVIIPCFTLQPIVENAIIHGIEPKVEGGRLRVKAYRDKDSTVIKIIDNGIGIENAIMSLRENEKSGHTSAIGVSNVMSRLKIFCGKKNCFVIKSKVGLGTMAVIRIPLKRG